MVIRFITLLFFLSINNIIVGQELTSILESENKKLTIAKVDSYSLTEDYFLISDILDVSAVNDELILSLSSEPGVIKYTERGKKQIRVGNFGRGPFEYLKADIVNQFHESKDIYTWDASQLKLSQFNSEGQGIKEFVDFRWSWGDFELLDDYIFIYNKGRSSGKYIQKFDLERSEITKEYGEIDQTHAFLKIFEGSGGITRNDEFIYFISPSSLTVNRINTIDDSINKKTIYDDDFVVPEIDSAFEIVQQGKDRIN